MLNNKLSFSLALFALSYFQGALGECEGQNKWQSGQGTCYTITQKDIMDNAESLCPAEEGYAPITSMAFAEEVGNGVDDKKKIWLEASLNANNIFVFRDSSEIVLKTKDGKPLMGSEDKACAILNKKQGAWSISAKECTKRFMVLCAPGASAAPDCFTKDNFHFVTGYFEDTTHDPAYFWVANPPNSANVDECHQECFANPDCHTYRRDFNSITGEYECKLYRDPEFTLYSTVVEDSSFVGTEIGSVRVEKEPLCYKVPVDCEAIENFNVILGATLQDTIYVADDYLIWTIRNRDDFDFCHEYCFRDPKCTHYTNILNGDGKWDCKTYEDENGELQSLIVDGGIEGSVVGAQAIPKEQSCLNTC